MRCVQRGGDAGEGGKASPRGRCSTAVASPRPWSGYFAPRSRIQGVMGDVVEEVRLDVDRDTADAAGHGGDPSRCPPPWPTPTKTGILTFARAGEGLQGTQAPIRGSMSGRIKRHLHLPQPSSHSPQRRRCLSSRDLRVRLKRCGMGFATQYWSGLSWTSTRLVSRYIPPLLPQGTRGHSRDPCTFEIPNSWLKKYPSAISNPRRFCSGTNASRRINDA